MTARPCLSCGEPSNGTRCPTCQAAKTSRTDRRRGSAHQRGYSSRWQRLSSRARRLQPFCLWCGSTGNLQTDHLRWPARKLADVRVLCQTCHATAPARRGASAEQHETSSRVGRNPDGRGSQTLGAAPLPVIHDNGFQLEEK